MNGRTRNRVIWALVILVAVALWALVARVRMHLVDELSFLGCVALAAAVLSALYWWDVSAESETDPPPNQIPNQSPPENPT
jgi:hypothetical protein